MIDETCSCGASFKVAFNGIRAERVAAARFREDHSACRAAGATLTPVECAALRSWNTATVKAVFPNADARRGFLASDVGRVMAKIAEGARGARS